MTADQLLAFLFDERSHALAAPMARWLASSRRFTAFVTTFRSKIRKKLRTVREDESLRDLRLELETAYLLLREKALSVVYEPQPTARARAPDFAVSFTTSLEFMVEVTRLRTGCLHAPPASPWTDERFDNMLGGKLGQLLPQRSNLLVVGVEGSLPAPQDLDAAMRRLQQRAEADDAALVQRHGFRDRSDFFRHYRRLSAMLLRGTAAPLGDPVLWVNPQAACPLPGKVRTALLRSHTL